MLTCREVSENAQDYTDANLSVWMRMRIWLHLAMCRNCSRFVDQTRKTKQLISQSLAHETQAEVSPELLEAFKQKASKTNADTSASGGVNTSLLPGGKKENQKDL